VNLEWTDEAPTKEGWYWAKYAEGYGGAFSDKEVVYVKDGDAHCVFWDRPVGMIEYCLWLGPLPVPELPTPNSMVDDFQKRARKALLKKG